MIEFVVRRGIFLAVPAPARFSEAVSSCVRGLITIWVLLDSTCARKRTVGVASLEVGRVREIGLDVKQDSPNHANIVGLPHREDDLAEAERSHVVWQPN
jgi:hypothetical protein